VAAAQRMLQVMDDHGISHAAACAGGIIGLDQLAEQVMVGGLVEHGADNRGLLEACSASGGRLLPFYFGNPHTDPSDYRGMADQFHGLELSTAVHGVPFTDRRMLRWVEAATEVGHPIYLVCLGRAGCSAQDLAGLAKCFPDTAFVLGHCGFIGIDIWSVNQIVDHENVLAETSGCYTGVARLAVQRLGADRVLFGTEAPLQHPGVEIAKVQALGLDQAAWSRVLSGNAIRLLERGFR
jgi:predicted TIM-barrel fold metal-dependent hydrolase